MSDFEVVLPDRPLLVTLAVRPEEVEIALATGCDSLRQRLLLALVAELTTIELNPHLTGDPLDRAG